MSSPGYYTNIRQPRVTIVPLYSQFTCRKLFSAAGMGPLYTQVSLFSMKTAGDKGGGESATHGTSAILFTFTSARAFIFRLNALLAG